MEHNRSIDKLYERWNILVSCAQGKASNTADFVLKHKAHAEKKGEKK